MAPPLADGDAVEGGVELAVAVRIQEAALASLKTLLAELGLEPKAAKTRILHLRERGEGIDFLGFHHRWVRARDPRQRHIAFLARWPSRQAMQRARDRVRELTGRDRLRWPIEQIVQDLNQPVPARPGGLLPLRHWTVQFDEIIRHADTRLALWVAKRHQQHRRYGRQALAARPDRFGLVSLNGTIADPRTTRRYDRARNSLDRHPTYAVAAYVAQAR